MSLLSLEGMEFFSYHGCFKEEQIIGNKFIINLYIEIDTIEAEKTDDLNKTLNYQSVYKLISKEMEIKSHLIENICYRIINVLYNNFNEIKHLKIQISKLNPPLGGKIDKVSITISK